MSGSYRSIEVSNLRLLAMEAADSQGDSRLHFQVKNTFLDFQTVEDGPAVKSKNLGITWDNRLDRPMFYRSGLYCNRFDMVKVSSTRPTPVATQDFQRRTSQVRSKSWDGSTSSSSVCRGPQHK